MRGRSRWREPGVSNELDHEETFVAADFAARSGCRAVSAVTRCDASSPDTGGEIRRKAAFPDEFCLRAARRDHGSVDAHGGWIGFRIHTDPETAGAVPRAPGDRQRTG